MPSKRYTASFAEQKVHGVYESNSLNGYTLLRQRVKRHFFGAPDSVGLNGYTLGFFFEKVKGVKGSKGSKVSFSELPTLSASTGTLY